MDARDELRAVDALEVIGKSLARLADVAENHFNKRYPVKREAPEVTVTHVPNEEDRIREAQGDTGEATVEEWIGNREGRFLQEIGKPRSQARR